MAKRTRKQQAEISIEDKVRLKPFLGIRPGIYLTFIYGLIILVIFFIVFILPGLGRNGTITNFVSYPSGAAVYIDNVYKGSTPVTVLVEKGERIIKTIKPFFSEEEEVISVKGRVFGSLFFPKKDTYVIKLDLTDPPGYLADGINDFIKWSLPLPYGQNYQPPLLLHEVVSAVSFNTNLDSGNISELLLASLKYSTEEAHLAAVGSAFLSYIERGTTLGPVGFLEALNKFIHLQVSLDNTFLLLYSSLSDESKKVLWDPAEAQELQKKISLQASAAVNSGQREVPLNLTLLGIQFVSVPGGSFIQGDGRNRQYAPHPVSLEPFYIADKEITNSLFTRFLMENPQWNDSERDKLISAGLVTEDYLKAWNPVRNPEIPVTYVSYFAAKAFCGWIEESLPASYAGYSVRLPKEEEMEWISLLGSPGDVILGYKEGPASVQGRSPGILGIYDITGNLWNWCDNWYSPLGYLVTSKTNNKPSDNPPGVRPVEISVRGGSWANSQREIDSRIRGSQPPDWCTPFLGFRPVLVRK